MMLPKNASGFERGKEKLPVPGMNRGGEVAAAGLKIWAGRLQDISERISGLNAETEEDFLEIGESLVSFHSRAEEITETSISLMKLLGGESLAGYTEGLNSLLGNMDGMLADFKRSSGRQCSALEQMLQKLERTVSSLAGLEKISSNMRRTGTLIKIFSAPLRKNAGFIQLADDIEALSQRIDFNMKNTGEMLSGIIVRMRKDLASIPPLELEQLEFARGIFQGIKDAVAQLSERRLDIQSSMNAIASLASEVSDNTGEIIMSMQFHDITRQQMEKVRKRLDKRREKLLSTEGPVSPLRAPGPGEDEADEGRHPLSASLLLSRDQIFDAVDDVKTRLASISEKITEVAILTNSLAEETSEAEQSFLQDVESKLATFSGKAQEMNELSGTMRASLERLEEIASFIGDIEDIGEHMEIISYNAKIKASQLGTEGSGLSVLADTVQNDSRAAAALTQAISQTLAGVSSEREAFYSSLSADAESKQRRIEEMMQKVRGSVNSLKDINSEQFGHLATMNDQATDLSGDIDQTVHGTVVHQRIHRALSDIIGEVREVEDVLGGPFEQPERPGMDPSSAEGAWPKEIPWKDDGNIEIF